MFYYFELHPLGLKRSQKEPLLFLRGILSTQEAKMQYVREVNPDFIFPNTA